MQIEIKKNATFNEIRKFCELNSSQTKSLEDFVLLLLQENHKFNFIGKSTIDDLWNRHILDSAQLLKFIDNKNAKFVDFGSGAGFPGMVISILGIKEIHLIEKSFRKCEFLYKAKLLSSNRIFVHQAQLEELLGKKFDVITSRALAPLDQLLGYSHNFLQHGGYAVFLKGKNLNQELDNAKKLFSFSYELYPSITSNESKIIKVFDIKKLSS
jgi:16S rRNA (guanine527-N7)-methyltransferase